MALCTFWLKEMMHCKKSLSENLQRKSQTSIMKHVKICMMIRSIVVHCTNKSIYIEMENAFVLQKCQFLKYLISSNNMRCRINRAYSVNKQPSLVYSDKRDQIVISSFMGVSSFWIKSNLLTSNCTNFFEIFRFETFGFRKILHVYCWFWNFSYGKLDCRQSICVLWIGYYSSCTNFRHFRQCLPWRIYVLMNINTIAIACERKYLSFYRFEMPVAVYNFLDLKPT